jgi:hypothetical protein
MSTGQRALQPGEDAGLAEAAGRSGRDASNIFADYPPCPAQPQAGGQARQLSPAEYAARFWQDVPLPSPQPHIAPGWAITGKLAYLETRGQLAHSYTRDTPIGLLSVNATGRYYVDWGDGTTTGPHGEGGPWPDGRITHEYIDVGVYDVVVTERWTATWRLGAESGDLSELRTAGRIDDFPVEQIQAVRYR